MRARLILIAWWLCLVGTAVAQAPLSTDEVAVVVNMSNPVNELSFGELRKIFAAEKHQWPNGIPIRLIVRGPGTRERQTLLRLLRMSESDYNQYWTAEVIRGEASAAPAVMPSVGMQREAILAFPGAITLVAANEIKQGMKIIKIDGHLPGEGGYPLR